MNTTIRYSDAKMIRELFLKGGIDSLDTLLSLNEDSLKRLSKRAWIAVHQDKIILTDVGMDVGQKIAVSL